MQEPGTEHNWRLTRGALAAAFGTGAVAFGHGPRLFSGPTAAECLFGACDGILTRHAAAAAGLLAVLVTAALHVAVPRLQRCGWFGAMAGAGLAGGMALLTTALRPLSWDPVVIGITMGLLAGLLAASLSVLFREQGLLSLLVVPVVTLTPTLLAHQLGRWRAAAAEPVSAVQRAAPPGGAVVLAVADEDARRAVAGLVAALRPPCFPSALQVFAVPDGSAEARWLQRMGLPLLRVTGHGAERLPDLPRSQLLALGALRVDAGLREGDGSLWVRAGPLGAHGTWTVFLPWGSTSGVLDADGKGGLTAPLWTAALHAGGRLPGPHRIRVLCVSRALDPAYGWTELSLP